MCLQVTLTEKTQKREELAHGKGRHSKGRPGGQQRLGRASEMCENREKKAGFRKPALQLH
jgi:hypothetical protein